VPALLICRFRRNRLHWNAEHVGTGAERRS
jgi:hypothetical protein